MHKIDEKALEAAYESQTCSADIRTNIRSAIRAYLTAAKPNAEAVAYVRKADLDYLGRNRGIQTHLYSESGKHLVPLYLTPRAPEAEAVGEITQECRYCANTGWFYGDPDLKMYCGCPFGKVREDATPQPTPRDTDVPRVYEDAVAEAKREVTLTYKNWRGEVSERTIVPKKVWFGSTEWHPEPQWLLTAFDVEKQAERDFALKDFGQPQAERDVVTDEQVNRIGEAVYGRHERGFIRWPLVNEERVKSRIRAALGGSKP